MSSGKKDKNENAPQDGGEEQNKPQAADSEKEKGIEEKYSELDNRFVRLSADFENYRKRAEKERQTARLEGIRDIAASIFGILDSLDLALRHGGQPGADADGLIQGVRLTYDQGVSQLQNFGITQISAGAGEKFNPALHQAIEKRHSSEVPEGCIVEEIAKGYTAGETLVRPVVVAVSSGGDEKGK